MGWKTLLVVALSIGVLSVNETDRMPIPQKMLDQKDWQHFAKDKHVSYMFSYELHTNIASAAQQYELATCWKCSSISLMKTTGSKLSKLHTSQ